MPGERADDDDAGGAFSGRSDVRGRAGQTGDLASSNRADTSIVRTNSFPAGLQPPVAAALWFKVPPLQDTLRQRSEAAAPTWHLEPSPAAAVSVSRYPGQKSKITRQRPRYDLRWPRQERLAATVQPELEKDCKKKKAQRKDRATALELRRRTRIRECPFVAGPLRRTTMFTKRSEAALVADRRYLHKQTLRMVDTRSTGTALERLHEKQNFQVWRTTSFSSPAEVLRQLRKTDIVLLEKETHWQQEPREPSSSTQDFPLLLWTLSMTTVHRTQ